MGDFGPLMKAAKRGDELFWRSFLEEFPDITSAEDLWGCTALHVAAHIGSAAMAQELITRGANVNAKEAWGETPLHIAARENAVGVCRLLAAGHASKTNTCALLLENGGNCGGVADDKIPALVNTLLLCRMIAPLDAF